MHSVILFNIFFTGDVIVVVVFGEDLRPIKCKSERTISDIAEIYRSKIESNASLALFADDSFTQQLPENATIGEVLGSSTAPNLNVYAAETSKITVTIFGFEGINAEIELAAVLTPAAARRQIARALDVAGIDGCQFALNGKEIEEDKPFGEQGLEDGSVLEIDLRVVIDISFDDSIKRVTCFGSHFITDLRDELQLTQETALVAKHPYLRILDGWNFVCDIATKPQDLTEPIQFLAEQKKLVTFAPLGIKNHSKQIAIFMASLPLDVYDLITEEFSFETEFRLVLNDRPLDIWLPFQLQISPEDIVEIDFLRPCVFTSRHWEDPLDFGAKELVYLYSTECSTKLYIRDALTQQRVCDDELDRYLPGAIVDIVGPTCGQISFLFIDVNEERTCSFLTFNKVVERIAWAKEKMLEVVPMSGGSHPKEIMYNGKLVAAKRRLGRLRVKEGGLTITDPKKVFVAMEKKLALVRLAQRGTFSDVHSVLMKMKGARGGSLMTGGTKIKIEQMSKEVDEGGLFHLSNALTVEVTIKGRSFQCPFSSNSVNFSDILLDITKQKKMARLLVIKTLFCSGCGRRLNKEEEPYQAVPSSCCSVRSLNLTDRPGKDQYCIITAD